MTEEGVARRAIITSQITLRASRAAYEVNEG